MKISTLIARLTDQVETHGDLPVVFSRYENYSGTLEEFELVDGYLSHEYTPAGAHVVVLWDK